jgi:hypothetical protein
MLHPRPYRLAQFLARLAADKAGNTIMLVAASLLPLLAMVGGGVDMSRSYLSQSRLQQACDAGVLAARKELGTDGIESGFLPDNAAQAGQSFFDVNFRDGAYGTDDRNFTMTLEDDFSISGDATVDVPTTIMRVFGYTNVPVHVSCTAQLNMSNTDVMMVLDTTGSMRTINPGDSETRIEALRRVAKEFHAQLEAAKGTSRVRYGFVPYSSNVNVGWLLNSGWMVDDWHYQGREAVPTGATETFDTFAETWDYVSGSSYNITPYEADSCPASTITWTEISSSTDADGTEHRRIMVDGTSYWCQASDNNQVTVNGTTYNRYVYDWTRRKTGTVERTIHNWRYKELDVDVSSLKGSGDNAPMVGGAISLPMLGWPSSPSPMTAWFQGCIEERDTYEIDDYSNVDFSKALDLDIDLVPDSSDPDTQWRPMLHEFSFERSIDWGGNGTFTPHQVMTPNDFLIAGWANLSTCPSPARRLEEMGAEDFGDYVDGLSVGGNTYHDIGMIWGGRLLSPTGLFAGDNADEPNRPTSRHMIFLTDGETAPRDLVYGTYGIEPLDRRRWSPSSPLTLTQVVERRFTVACNEVKKRNITVWLVGFGTNLNGVMTDCAGPGHSFEAANAAELSDAFRKIAGSIAELRITR